MWNNGFNSDVIFKKTKYYIAKHADTLKYYNHGTIPSISTTTQLRDNKIQAVDEIIMMLIISILLNLSNNEPVGFGRRRKIMIITAIASIGN